MKKIMILLLCFIVIASAILLYTHGRATENIEKSYHIINTVDINTHVSKHDRVALKHYVETTDHMIKASIAVLMFLGGIYAVFIIFLLIIENKNSEKTLAWMLVIIFLPIIGVLLYLFFGDSISKKNLYKKRRETAFLLSRATRQSEIDSSSVTTNGKLIHFIAEHVKEPVAKYNLVKLYFEGEALFSEMIEAIEQAKDSVHLEVYILNNDMLGARFREALIKKAESGVEVRVLLDYMGSLKLGRNYRHRLKKAGVKFAYFIPFINRQMNHRNHRKILIIDGKVGFIGGFNIGDEYLGLDKSLGYWRDTHMKVQGDSVYSLQDIFVNDWLSTKRHPDKPREYLTQERFFPKLSQSEKEKLPKCPIQLVYSGLDSKTSFIFYQYYYMISNAKRRIWITTPYLILGESMRSALKLSAFSGVDVRIIIPSKVDHISAYFGTRGNVEELLEAGVKIYSYNKGFIHAKSWIVDDELASIGTANFDVRSLYVNFEVNSVIYDKSVVKQLEKQFLVDFSHCDELEYDIWKKRGVFRRFFEGVIKLLSPLL